MGTDTPTASISFAHRTKLHAHVAQSRGSKLAANANSNPFLPDRSPDASPVEARMRRAA